MAGLGEEPGRLSCHQYPIARARCRSAVARTKEAENTGRMARSDDFRCSPGLRGFGRLDFRTQEHTVAGVLSIEHFVVSALRGRAVSWTLLLLALADGVCPGVAQQDFDGDAARGGAAVRLVAARADHCTRRAANQPLFSREPGLWFDDDLVPSAPDDAYRPRRNGNFLEPACRRGQGNLVLSGQGLASREPKHDLPAVDSRSNCAGLVPSFARTRCSIDFALAISPRLGPPSAVWIRLFHDHSLSRARLFQYVLSHPLKSI